MIAATEIRPDGISGGPDMMTRLTSEPSAPVRSMDDLMAIAFAMEKESVDRYADLAARMRAAGREDLAVVFDQLVKEETGHMDTIIAWSQQVLHSAPTVVEYTPAEVFDDDGAAFISPELLNAYHSFAIAVRNEERAFAFWAYVSANAPNTEVREAAERLAREELEHAKTLRRERRKAFFHRRRKEAAMPPDFHDPAALELEVCKALEVHSAANGQPYRDLANEARLLSGQLAANPLPTVTPAGAPPRSLEALCEWLADYYIDAGEQLHSDTERDRAQGFATAAIRRLALVRHMRQVTPPG